MHKSNPKTIICIDGHTWYPDKPRRKTFKLLHAVLGETAPDGCPLKASVHAAIVASDHEQVVPEIMSFLAQQVNENPGDMASETAFWVCALALTHGLQFSAIKGIKMDKFRFGEKGEITGFKSSTGGIFSELCMNNALTSAGFDKYIERKNGAGDEFLFPFLHDAELDGIRFNRGLATLVQQHLRTNGVSDVRFSVQYLNDAFRFEVVRALARKYAELNPHYVDMGIKPVMQLVGGMWKMLSEIPYTGLSRIAKARHGSRAKFVVKAGSPCAGN